MAAELDGFSTPPKATHRDPAPRSPADAPGRVSILTYNIWFEEGRELEKRMAGLSDLVAKYQPDILMFQYEVTEPVTDEWYFTILAHKRSSLQAVGPPMRHPFSDEIMGRDVAYQAYRARHSPPHAPLLLAATSHLVSPVGQRVMSIREDQVREATQLLTSEAQRVITEQGSSVDIVWGGDMNWIPQHTREPDIPTGWIDVWTAHADPNKRNCTWDPYTNKMLKGELYPPSRLDRMFARLSGWRVESVDLVGTEPCSLTNDELYISDHYGILASLQPT